MRYCIYFDTNGQGVGCGWSLSLPVWSPWHSYLEITLEQFNAIFNQAHKYHLDLEKGLVKNA